MAWLVTAPGMVPCQQGAVHAYGVDDQGIPPAEHARVVRALSAAKKRYVLNVYPGAGHAFLCEERATYAPGAAALAWRDALDFLLAQLG